jgi:uncharacterized protein YodC (DUF2158 family)
MSDEQTKSDAPEARKLVPGDIVQLKGGHGPKMTVASLGTQYIVKCSWWSKEHNDFGERDFHPDSLAYFAEPVPSLPTISQHPITQSAEVLSIAIRNGRHLIDRRADWATVHQCFEVLVGEVQAHTGITA